MSSQPSGPPRKGQRNEMRMISRAAEVLRALAEEPAGLSLGQLAKATGLARSTVQRLVGALEAEGFAVTRPGQPGVKLGAELVRLGSAVHANLRSLFRPFLQELNHQTKDTVDLTLLMNGLPVVIDQITSTASLRVVSFVGRPLPLHCTASGKAHVSAMTDDEAKALLTPPLKGYTARTLTDSRTLLRLAGTAHEGEFHFDQEEFDEGICAIALPINTAGPDNYAVAVSMPATRFKSRLPQLRAALKTCQREMEAAAGAV
jgi:IclR family acetate operon transcriptional repressor